jgi:hypothetical protein
MTQRSWFKTLFSRKQPDPSYPDLPLVKENGESSVSGLYLTGDVGGTPLIKLGLNEGVDVVNRIHGEVGRSAGDDPALLDLVIVGAGASGLAAAMRAHELRMRYQVLEAEEIATTVVNMYRGKVLFAEPEGVPNRSGMWFEECTREELLERWRGQVRDAGLNVSEHDKVVDISKAGGHFSVTTERSAYRAKRPEKRSTRTRSTTPSGTRTTIEESESSSTGVATWRPRPPSRCAAPTTSRW